MNKHYKKQLSAFINHELPNDDRQEIGEHLLQCADCRKEHDEIKFGAALAGQLPRADAPQNVWNEIETALNKKSAAQALSGFPLFGPRILIPAAALLMIGGLMVIYFGFLRNNSGEVVKSDQPANFETPQAAPSPNEISSNLNVNSAVPLNNSNIQKPNTNSNAQNPPKIIPPLPTSKPRETLVAENDLPSWNVETLSGTPKAGNQTIGANGKLTVGEFLETDSNSRARVEVANIGQVEISPNSRVQLVKTQSTEHRLSLEKGQLKAKILAPPRLFIVDTPSAVAVDLGCEYTLEVDAEGNGKLHVTKGFVALERGGRESIVPAGAIALTKKGKGLGTPFAEDSSQKFKDALYKFDFENGGNEALQIIFKEADLYDSITLWHLLSRVAKPEREKVFDRLAALVKPPAGVTREGILKADKKMLEKWWTEIENVWFE